MLQACAEDSFDQFPSSERLLGKTGIVIPTYNAASYWPSLRAALDRQGLEPHQILIVDSSSSDRTDKLAEEAGYQVIRIPKTSFGHGITRQMATNHMLWADYVVFMTQDAIPASHHAVRNLVAAFESPKIGAAYGRQLPRSEADAIEAHARLFNYPCSSTERTLSCRVKLGFRTTFFSNSFAAYRRTALEMVGGFPDVIVSEDVSVVASMLLQGWHLAYQADAEVVHSHPMSLRTEFSRYFDIAVHHSRANWILREFGQVRGEGSLFLRSESRFLLRHAPQLLPLAMVKNAAKWLGYQLGLREAWLPLWAKRKISGQRGYWERSALRMPGGDGQRGQELDQLTSVGLRPLDRR